MMVLRQAEIDMLPADQNWNAIVMIVTAAVLAAILGFAYGATFSSGCPDIKDAPFGCAEFLLFRYQTLLGIGGAIIVATISARPVWRQFHLMGLQTTVTMNDALTERIRILNRRCLDQGQRVREIVANLNRGYAEAEGTASFTHWVWDIEQSVSSESEYLTAQQRENIEGDEATSARQRLIAAMNTLRACLSDINSEVHLERMEDEMEVTESMWVDARLSAAKATENLSSLIDEVSLRARELEEANTADLDELRLKRQLMNQILIESAPFN